MISDPRAFNSDIAWHFAFSNFWQVLREQRFVLVAMLVIDLALAFFTNGKFRVAGYLAAFPIFASAIRLVKPRFEMTAAMLVRLIVTQLVVTIFTLVIPVAFYVIGMLFGGKQLWLIAGLILTLPIGAKLALAAPLLLLDYGNGEPISDAISGSWRAMGGHEAFDLVILQFKMGFFITIILVIPMIIVVMVLRAMGLAPFGSLAFDAYQIVASALSCTIVIAVATQLFPNLVPVAEA